MKNLYIYIITLALFSGCGPKMIPGEELTKIFREAFLANAYYDNHRTYGIDSTDLYGPILARHGYTVADFEHTVANFARKKSTKLSDVVEQAIERLKAESEFYDSRVAAGDSVNATALRLTARRVWSADSIVVRRIADTARLRVRLPAAEGDYVLRYRYLIDTADKNIMLFNNLGVVDTAGRRGGSQTAYLTARGTNTRGEQVRLQTDSLDAFIELRLANYGAHLSAPHLRFDSVEIIHNMPLERALDSVSGRWTKNWRYDHTQNSGAPRPLPPRRDTALATRPR